MSIFTGEVYCPILNETISEIECYEYTSGCADSLIGKRYHKYTHEQMETLCDAYKYNSFHPADPLTRSVACRLWECELKYKKSI